MSDRASHLLSGAVLLVIALAVAAETTTFRVDFPTDPLGPAGLPLVAAGLIALGGMALLFEGGLGTTAPTEDGDDVPAVRTGSAAKGATAFLAYAVLLPWLGFVPATTALIVFLARLFGGPFRTSLAAGVVLSTILLLLFVRVLGLPLPVWPLGMGG